MTPTRLLSSMTNAEIATDARSTSHPKWNTLCLLRHLSLPTLDAALIPPDASTVEANACIGAFAARIGSSVLLVRSDGGRERSTYARGGNTVPIEQVRQGAETFLQQGRAVILMEPTNRFENRLTANLLLDDRGQFVVEILGPGFDTADLNRGDVPAQTVIHVDLHAWPAHEALWIHDVRLTRSVLSDAERRELRLVSIAKNLLPKIALDVPGGPEGAAAWLRERGFHALWQPWEFQFDLSRLQRWYDDAYVIASFLAPIRRCRALVLSGSLLGNGRWIYWDVVEPGTKWKAPAPALDRREHEGATSVRAAFARVGSRWLRSRTPERRPEAANPCRRQ